VDARADRRLADVKLVRGTDEVSARNDGQKGSGQLGVHPGLPFLVSIKSMIERRIIRLSKLL
jgi:hypothetical protein